MKIIKLKYKLLFVTFLVCVSSYSQQQIDQEQLKKANSLFEDGEYLTALEIYRQLLSVAPENQTLNFKYGACLIFSDEDTDEPVKYLKYGASESTDPLAYYFLGRALHLNYQFADAQAAYAKFNEKADSKLKEKYSDGELLVSMAKNGQTLLSQIKDIIVIDKIEASEKEFFRSYKIDDLGGKIIVTPEDLLSKKDKSSGENSLIYFQGSNTDIYFSSYGSGDQRDLYKAKRLENGKYTKPVKLGGGINTPYDENYPYMHPDGQTLYFSSKGHNSMGGYDIFKSVLNPNTGEFSPAENLDFAISSPDDDLFYIADLNKENAFFASGRSSELGRLNVYQVKVKAGNANMAVIKGNFIASDNNKPVSIRIEDAMTNNNIGVFKSDPVTGEYLLNLPKSGKYKFYVEEEGTNTIHSGVFEVPRGKGNVAYAQEMTFSKIGGTNQLVLNNLFEEPLDEDVSMLMAEALKRKGQLDINKDDYSEELAAEENAMAEAYKAAGFPLSSSNEQIKTEASKKADKYAKQSADDEADAKMIYAYAIAKREKANELMTLALKAFDDSKVEQDVSKKEELLLEAAYNKLEATKEYQEASNALEILKKLDKNSNEKYDRYEAYARNIEKINTASNSDDFDNMVIALEEYKVLKDTGEMPSTLELIQEENQEKRRQSTRALSFAQKIEEEKKVLAEKLVVREKQLSAATKKKDKELIAQDIAGMNEELADYDVQIQGAYKRYETRLNDQSNSEYQGELFSQYKLRRENDSWSSINPEEFSSQEIAEFDKDIRSSKRDADKIKIDEVEISQLLAKRSDIAHRFDFGEIKRTSEVDETKTEVVFQPRDPEELEFLEDESVEEDNLVVINKYIEPEDDFQVFLLNSAKEDNPVAVYDDKINIYKTQKESATKEEIMILDKRISDLESLKTVAQTEVDNETEDVVTLDDFRSESIAIAEKEFNEDNQQEIINWISTDYSAQKLAIINNDASEAEKQIQFNALNKKTSEKINIAKSELVNIYAANNRANTPKAKDNIEYLDQLESAFTNNSMLLAVVSAEEALTDDVISDEVDNIDTEQFTELSEDTIENTIDNVVEGTTDDVEDQIDDVVEGTTDDVENQIDDVVDDVVIEAIEDVEDPINDTVDNANATNDAIDSEIVENDIANDIGDELIEEEMLSNDESNTDEDVNDQTLNDANINTTPDVFDDLVDEVKPDDILNDDQIEDLPTIDDNAALVETEDKDDETGIEQNDIVNESVEEVVPEDTESVTDEELVGDETVDLNAPKFRMDELIFDEEGTLTENETVNFARTAGVEDLTQNHLAQIKLIDEGNDSFEEKTGEKLALEMSYLDALETRKLSNLGKLRNDPILLEQTEQQNEAIEILQRSIRLDMDKNVADIVQSKDIYFSQKELIKSRYREDYIDELTSIEQNNINNSTKTKQRILLDNMIAFKLEKEIDQLEVAIAQPNISDLEKQTLLNKVDRKRKDYNEIRWTNTISLSEMESPITEEVLYERQKERSFMRDDVPRESDYTDLIKNEGYKQTNLHFDEAKMLQEEAEFDLLMLESKKPILSLSDFNQAEMKVAEKLVKAYDAELDELNREIELIDFEKFSDPFMVTKAKDYLVKADTWRNSVNSLGQLSVNAVGDQKNNMLKEQISSQLNAIEYARHAEAIVNYMENDNANDPFVFSDFIIPNSEISTIQEKPNYLLTEDVFNESYSPPNYLAEEFVATNNTDRTITNLTDDNEQIENNSNDNEVNNVIPVDNSEIINELDTADLITAETLSEEDVQEATIRLNKESIKQVQPLNSNGVTLSGERMRSVENEPETKKTQSAVVYYQKRSLIEQLNEMMVEQVDLQKIYADKIYKKEQGLIVVNESLASDGFTNVLVKEHNRLVAELEQLKKYDTIAKNNVLQLDKQVDDEELGLVALKQAMDEELALAEFEVVDELSVPEIPAVLTRNIYVRSNNSEAGYSDASPIPVDPVMPSGVIYQVQVGAYRQPIPQDLFKGFTPIMGERIQSGITRYKVGLFTSYSNANTAKNEIRGLGYSDAFVVVFNDGNRISMAEARKLATGDNALANDNSSQQPIDNNTSNTSENNATENASETIEDTSDNAPNTTTSTIENLNVDELPIDLPAVVDVTNGTGIETLDSYVFIEDTSKDDYYSDPDAAEAKQVEMIKGLFYTVQIGAYSKPVAADKLLNVSPLNTELTDNGLVRYTTGRFTDLNKVSSYKTQIVNKGVADAFISAYFNGYRITLSKARQLMEEQGDAVLMDSSNATDGVINANVTTTNTTQTDLGAENTSIQDNNTSSTLEEENNTVNRPKDEVLDAAYSLIENGMPGQLIWDLLEEEALLDAVPEEDQTYKVILGPFEEAIPTREVEIILNFRDNIRFEERGENAYVYSSINPIPYSEARKLKETLEAEGIETAKIVSFKGGREISLKEFLDGLSK